MQNKTPTLPFLVSIAENDAQKGKMGINVDGLSFRLHRSRQLDNMILVLNKLSHGCDLQALHQ